MIRLLRIREAKRRSAKRLSKDIPEIPAPLQQNLWPLLEEILKAHPEAEFVQLQINLSYMKDFRPLDESEMRIIRKAREAFGRSKRIGCTACGCCAKGCPKEIPIPQIFAAMNL